MSESDILNPVVDKRVFETALVTHNPPALSEESEGYATENAIFPLPFATAGIADLLGNHEQKLGDVLAAHRARAPHNPGVGAASGENARENRGGRPLSFDTAAKQKVCQLVQLGYSRVLAATEVGISRSTLARALHRDPAFRRQVREGEELFERGPLLTVVEAAQRDWRAAVWLLKNYQPKSVNMRQKLAEIRRRARESSEFFKAHKENYDARMKAKNDAPSERGSSAREGDKKKKHSRKEG